jgi:hypothetical protein
MHARSRLAFPAKEFEESNVRGQDRKTEKYECSPTDEQGASVLGCLVRTPFEFQRESIVVRLDRHNERHVRRCSGCSIGTVES